MNRQTAAHPQPPAPFVYLENPVIKIKPTGSGEGGDACPRSVRRVETVEFMVVVITISSSVMAAASALTDRCNIKLEGSSVSGQRSAASRRTRRSALRRGPYADAAAASRTAGLPAVYTAAGRSAVPSRRGRYGSADAHRPVALCARICARELHLLRG